VHDDIERAAPQVPIPESDEALLAECRVETFRAGGKGGQHQNRTESGVRLVHLPSGVRASARNERSQHRNKSIALARLRRKLEKRNERRAPRVATAVPPREKEKRRKEKRARSKVKSLRRRPPADDE
jgi:peptide chain release factor 2